MGSQHSPKTIKNRGDTVNELAKKLTIEETLDLLIGYFKETSHFYDHHSRLPKTNFEALVNHKLHTLPLEPQFGGKRYSFLGISSLITNIAIACPPTALCLAMHYYTLAGLRDVSTFPLKEKVFKDVWDEGQFVASFNQPNVVMVQRNQNYRDSSTITIEKVRGGYLVNGVKPTVSGAKYYKYYPVYGHQSDVGSRFGLTALLLTKDDPGVEVQDSWNLAAMRSTGGDSIRFHNVFVPENRLIGREGYGIEDTPSMIFWSRLAISSVYLGIAKSAVEYTVDVLKRKKDLISKRSAAFMPGNQFRYADMRIKLETAISQLQMYGKHAEEEAQTGSYTEDLYQKAAITKYVVSKAANEIVWMAMEMEGSASMQEGSKLEKLYRDVRAATFHQPSEDLLKEILAKRALGIITTQSRWV